MKYLGMKKYIKRIAATTLVAVITLGSLPLSRVYAERGNTNNPDIQKIDNIALDYSKYFDNSVVFKLPETSNKIRL